MGIRVEARLMLKMKQQVSWLWAMQKSAGISKHIN